MGKSPVENEVIAKELTLEERVWKFMGVPNPEVMAIMLDAPEIIPKIKKTRYLDYGLDILKDFSNAAISYFFGRIFYLPAETSAVGLAGAGTVNLILEAATSRLKHERYYLYEDPFAERIFEIMPYQQQINSELGNRGYPDNGLFSVFLNMDGMEEKKIGMKYIDLFLNPATQITAAVGVVPLWLIGGATALSYSLLPYFGKLGKNDQKLNQESSTISDAMTMADLADSRKIKPSLSDSRKTLRRAIQLRSDFQNVFSKTSTYLSALALPFISKEAFLGTYRFLDTITTLPSNYRRLKKDEIITNKSIAVTETLADILSGSPFLLTKESWDNYRHNKKITHPKESDGKGIYFRRFQTKIPDMGKKRHTPQLNLNALPGKIYLLQAPSGSGKSVSTQLGMAGVVETLGTMLFVDSDGSKHYLEDFAKNEVEQRVFYIGQSIGFHQLRVADMFNKYAVESYLIHKKKIGSDSEELETKIRTLPEKEIYMVSMRDVYLEQQLCLMADLMKKEGIERKYRGYEKHTIKTEGINLIFPYEMFDTLADFRKYRNNYIRNMLKSKASNLQTVKADQSLGQLSHGMLARVMFEYNKSRFGSTSNGEANLIILDEVTDSLHSEAKIEVMKEVDELRNRVNAPSIIWISQSDIERIQEYYGDNCVKVNFGKSIYNKSFFSLA